MKTLQLFNLSQRLCDIQRILDFSAADGDRIDRSKTDVDASSADAQSFTLIGSEPFAAAGQLRFAKGVLAGDVDGAANLSIFIGTGQLEGGDPIL